MHFHDLRHTGNTLAAQAGATMSDLMARMGHGSPRAALIYQHATSEADRELAAGLNRLIARERVPDASAREEERWRAWRSLTDRQRDAMHQPRPDVARMVRRAGAGR